LKQQLVHPDNSPQNYLQAKHSLYKRYSGMLLGYLLEIVKDQTIAEQYLVDTFAGMHPAEVTEISTTGNAFCHLQFLVRKKLKGFFDNLESCGPEEKPQIQGNKFVELMNNEQQQVFCGVHYSGKTTAKLATELGKTEYAIRQLLKESFTIIRNYRNDT
jgi:hypothetical protein